MNKQKLVSTAKYAGTSITIGTALVQILLFAFPTLAPIQEAITALVIFAANIALVYSGVISDTE